MRIKIGTDWLIKLFPLFLFFFNVVTKLLYLTNEDIALDEPFSIYHAQFKVADIIEQLKNYNNPPLFEIVLHFWIKCFGISALSVRVLPMLFACLSPVALFLFAKKFYSLQIAITSALLLSFSNLLIFYSHDCRVYSLFLLLSILSMHYFLTLVWEEKRNYSTIFWFILVSSLLIYAHYFGAFILFLQFIYLLVFCRNKLIPMLLFYLLIFFAYIPHTFVLIARFNDSVRQGTWLHAPEGIESLYYMLWSFSNYPVLTVACLIVLIFALAKKLMFKTTNITQSNNYLVVIWFLFPFLGMFLISYYVPMFFDRYLIFCLPAYYLLVPLSINNLFFSERKRIIALSLLVVSFALGQDLDPKKKQPVSKVVHLIKKNKNQATLVIVKPAYFLPIMAYHLNRNAFSEIGDGKEYFRMDSLMKKDNIYHINHATEALNLITDKYNNIILFTVGTRKNEDQIQKFLEPNFKSRWTKAIKSDWLVECFIKE